MQISYKDKWWSAAGFSSRVSRIRIDVQWLINATKKLQERVIQAEVGFFKEVRLKAIFAKPKGSKIKVWD